MKFNTSQNSILNNKKPNLTFRETPLTQKSVRKAEQPQNKVETTQIANQSQLTQRIQRVRE
jgi:hypothetical protein